jgi:adenylate kinase family enzyme
MGPPPLESLGQRIVILGPSGAGKSTLCAALALKLGARPVHLDTYFHQPGTKWQPRPAVEFIRLHASAIAGDRWVSDGNYSRLLSTRLDRATGVLWVDVSRWAGMLGYLRRSLFGGRYGRLAGAPDGLNWKMTRYILWDQPRKREGLVRLLAGRKLPIVHLRAMRELQQAYRDWELVGPG